MHLVQIPQHTVEPFLTSMTVQELVEKNYNPKLQHSGTEMLADCGGSFHRISRLLDFQGAWWKTGPKEAL